MISKKLNDFIHEVELERPDLLENGFTFQSDRFHARTTFINNQLDYLDFIGLSMYKVKSYHVFYPKHGKPSLYVCCD